MADWFALAICTVAEEVAELDPPELLAVTVTFKY